MDSFDKGIKIHEDKRRFREALIFSEQLTGFGARLIEKDYYCSLVLHDLTIQKQNSLIFKGGTCLCKVHGDFYRMSEDLDFLISTDTGAIRPKRRELIEPLKSHFSELPGRLSGFRIYEGLRGHDNSKHYAGSLSYKSVITGEEEFIKIEISLREPVLESIQNKAAKTLVIDPFTGRSMVDAIPVNVLSYSESYAEKFRAALTRRNLAIRDFYDIDVAIRSGRLSVNSSAFIDLIRNKIAIPGTNAIDISEDRINILHNQLETELKPVLRSNDYANFDVKKAITIVIDVMNRLNFNPGKSPL